MGVETCRGTEGWGQVLHTPQFSICVHLHHLRMSWQTAALELLRRNPAVMRPYLQIALMEEKTTHAMFCWGRLRAQQAETEIH